MADSTAGVAQYGRLAEIFNAAILRGLMGYLLVNAIIYARVLFPHVRRWPGSRFAAGARLMSGGQTV